MFKRGNFFTYVVTSTLLHVLLLYFAFQPKEKSIVPLPVEIEFVSPSQADPLIEDVISEPEPVEDVIPKPEPEQVKKELKKLVLDDKKSVAKEESSDEDIATKKGGEERPDDSLDLDGEKIKDREKSQYCAKIREQLKALIKAKSKKKVLTVVFVIRVQRDGVVSHAAVKVSSGNNVFDEYVKDTIKKSQLCPIPKKLDDKHITFNFTYVSDEN